MKEDGELRDKLSCRMKIIGAMDGLMEESSIDAVTVTDICKQAGISRQAFYKLFADKYDVVEWVLKAITRSTVRFIGISFGWYEGFLRLHRAIRGFSRFLSNAARSTDVNSLPHLSYEMAKQDYLHAARHQLHSDRIPELIEFQIEAFAHTTTETTTRWMMDGMKEPPESFSQKMVTLVPRELYELLDIESSDYGEWNLITEYLARNDETAAAPTAQS